MIRRDPRCRRHRIRPAAREPAAGPCGLALWRKLSNAGGRGLGWALQGLGIAGVAAWTLGGVDQVQARGRHPAAHTVDNPPYADIVIDDNSGQVLHELNPDEPRHPASLPNVMTLYLLFEALAA